MNKLVLLLTLVAGLVAAKAQDNVNNYWSATPLFSTASLPGRVLTNGVSVTNVFRVSGKDLGLQWNVQASGASTSNAIATVAKSIDGRNWDTLATFTLAASGTTPVSVSTNYTVNAIPWVRVVVTTTAIAPAGLTNTSLFATSK